MDAGGFLYWSVATTAWVSHSARKRIREFDRPMAPKDSAHERNSGVDCPIAKSSRPFQRRAAAGDKEGTDPMIPGRSFSTDGIESEISIEAGKVTLDGVLGLPKKTNVVVLFAHGSGSSRHSPRNRYVAQVLQSQGIGALLFDLLTRDEESIDDSTGELRFNIPFLAERLKDATRWLIHRPDMPTARFGYFGASTGAAAAMVAAADMPSEIHAIVSRGGRPDLAGPSLQAVRTPTLLIVGGDDEPVIGMNQDALAQLRCEKKLVIVPGATHLFEEPGTLEEVAKLAAQWFKLHLTKEQRSARTARR